ncbi:MAG: PP2C family protein-serine/threonine phosphatase [Candidatus Nanopelagicales bacterium]
MDRGGGPSLRTRVTLLAVVGLVLLGIVALVVWAAYADVRRVGDDAARRLSPASDLSADLVVAYDRVDRESRSYVLTGDPSARTRYEAARERVAGDTAALRPLLAADPALAADLDDVDTAAEAWLPVVVDPAVAARAQGPLTVAQLQEFVAASTNAYLPVATATSTLQGSVNDARDAAFDQLTAVARRLALALAVAGMLLLGLVAASYLLVRRWVLTPLDELSGQLQEVTRDGQRDQVIEPTGPPELRAVGADAESMRRALVAETDAARAADESLVMQGPVVAAVRADLATETAPRAARLAIHGELHPAEGVLAGDWWGVIPLADERTALLVVDVSGHGPLAGLVTMRLRAVMSVALRSGFDPATALERAAVALADSEDGRFATSLVAVLDPAAGTVRWANAGHPAGWLLPGGRTEGRRALEPTGPLLSSLGGAWSTSQAALDVDDVLLTWSDGLVETREASDEVDDVRLARLIDELETATPAELVPALLARLREDAPEWRRDDITLVAVRRTS